MELVIREGKEKVVLSCQNSEEALFILNKELESRKEYYWQNKNKELIPIKDMSTLYIQNVISVLERSRELSELACDHASYIDDLD